MTRPLVGCTTRRWAASAVADLPPAYAADGLVDLGIADYPAALAAAGGLPVHLARDADPAEVVERLDALVLTGGADVSCASSASPAASTEPERDRWELALLAAALERGLPVLCICRGVQLLNVSRGGTLVADLPAGAGDDHPRWDRHRSLAAHPVALDPGSLAASVYGSSVTVNSLHHQAVDRLGDGLVATGRSPDGTIEAVEWPGRPILAVQWHPESLPGDPGPAWLVAQALAAAR